MTSNEILARWQGWTQTKVTLIGNKGSILTRAGYMPPNSIEEKSLPDYPNDSAAAMSLLDTLVSKGYFPQIKYYKDEEGGQWGCNPDEEFGWEYLDENRNEAIVAACLEVAREEQAE